MKNQKINMSILIFLIIFQTILVSSARSVSPWTPNTSDPPPGTYEHVGGFTYTAAEGPLYTNIEEIRVDFWHVEETDTLVMSITIENGTGDKQGNNIFNQGAPASIKQDVNDFIDLFDDILNLPQINTIWELITDGVHSVNLV